MGTKYNSFFTPKVELESLKKFCDCKVNGQNLIVQNLKDSNFTEHLEVLGHEIIKL